MSWTISPQNSESYRRKFNKKIVQKKKIKKIKKIKKKTFYNVLKIIFINKCLYYKCCIFKIFPLLE